MALANTREFRPTTRLTTRPSKSNRRNSFNGGTKPEIRKEIKRIRHETLESTRRMVQLFDHSKDAGIGTLAALHQQSQQLDRVESDLDTIHSDLQKSETTLIRIENAETSMFLSCPCCVSCRKKHKEENPNLWQEGLRTSNSKSKSTGKHRPKNSSKSRRAKSKRLKISWDEELESTGKNTDAKSSRRVADDVKTELPNNRSSLEEETELNKNLDEAYKMVQGLKTIAKDVDLQLDRDSEKLDRIIPKTQSNVRRLSTLNQKSDKLLKQGGSSWCSIL